MTHLVLLSLLPLIAAHPYSLLGSRNAQVCSGDTSLNPCGLSYPPSFCCDQSTTCLPINGTSTTSVICCPAGQDCSTIATLTCNITLQDASLFPRTPVHTLNLTETLPQCGDECCPFGYSCHNGACVSVQPNTTGSPKTVSTTSNAGATHSTSSVTLVTSMTTLATQQISATATLLSSNVLPAHGTTFSGRSFAAGFMPGILLGAALLAVVLLWLRRRKTTKDIVEISNEKRLPTHRRQISNPIIHAEYGERTAFFHSQYNPQQAQSTQLSCEPTAGSLEPQAMHHNREVDNLFHKSPKETSNGFRTTMSSPTLGSLPLSLRRGSITPPHHLKTKQGIHSLRRQISQHSALSRNQSVTSHESRQTSSVRHQTSQETINIQMSLPRVHLNRSTTPVRPLFPPAKVRDAGKSGMWLSYRLPPEPVTARFEEPTTPYTPSKYGNNPGGDTLVGARESKSNRTTTFGELMERAGIRQSEMLGRRI